MSGPNHPSHDAADSPSASAEAKAPQAGGEPQGERVLQAIMFTDIEGSVSLAQQLGTERYAEVLTRHGALFYEAMDTAQAGAVEKHTGDGFMARFERPSDAVGVALRFQWLLRHEDWGTAPALRVRIGIHQGEIMLLTSERTMPGTIGTPVNLAARVMSMATGGQVLLTHSVFDDARQFIKAIPGVPDAGHAQLGWEAHGAYLVKGIDGPVDIFEVGERGFTPFQRPEDGAGARRSVSAEDEATLGWRPGSEMEVPKRAGWFLIRQLGEGGFGEVWLAQNRTTHEQRVFKFCFDAVRLRSFKREVLLFRLIRETLGQRTDMAKLYEVQLESAPFFLESEYCAGGTLNGWLEEKMRTGEVPLAKRLEIIVRLARALAAAHSVGIIHKDVKPSNIFIDESPDGTVQPRLADFGIGVLVDRSVVDALDLNFTGALTISIDPSRTGTRMYGAPEYMIAAPPSILGDIYSLGVLLYQVAIGDFRRPLGAGWRRDVPDALLTEDIAGCVDVDPQRRWSSATIVADRIEKLEERRAEQAAAAAAVQREEKLRRESAAHRRRMRVALTSTAVAVVLIAALTVMVVALQKSRVAEIKHSRESAAQREVARDQLYVADMQAATDDMLQWRAEAARELIQRHRPAPGERDRRGWEWFFADSVLNTKQLMRAVSAQPLRALAVSPDEKFAAVAGDDGELSVWSCDALEKTRSWHAGAVRALGWNAAGALAAGLANGEVALWESASGRELKRWKAHDGAVAALAWHPSEDTLATGGADGVLAWWRGSGERVREVRKQGPVLALGWQQDGGEIAAVLGHPARLLAGSPDGLEHEFAMDAEESALAWRPGAHEVAITMSGAPMRSWDPYTTVDSFSLSSQFSPGASAYAWSPDGTVIAVGGIDGKILVLDAHLSESRVALYGHTRRVTALHWLGKTRGRLLSAGDDGTLRAWDDLQRSHEGATLSFPVPLADAQWHPQRGQLAVLLAGDEVQVIESGEIVWRRPMPAPHDGLAPYVGGRLAWSPDGRWLAAACPGRGVVAWRLEDGKKFALAEVGDASDVQWMPDSRRLLVRTARGWSAIALDDGKGGAPLADAAAVWAGALDAEHVASVKARHFLAPGVDAVLPDEIGEVRVCALSVDRTQLAIGGEMGTVLWIDTHTGRITRPVVTHSGPVQALGWHPDGSRLVTAGADGTCRIFNVPQAAQNWMVEHRLPSAIVAAGWSADGRGLMLASAPGRQVKIYDAAKSLDRERGTPAPAEPAPTARLTRACADLAEHPGDESAWRAFAEEVRRTPGENAPLLLAAATLGALGRFTPLEESAAQKLAPVKEWAGVALPRAVLIAQACALQHWEEVAQLSAGDAGTDGWFALAGAEALAHLGRNAEAEAANLAAWQALRRLHGEPNPAATITPPRDGKPGADLSRFANIRLRDDWLGGRNNNFSELPAVLPQPDGARFHCADFIQLAGMHFRIAAGRMLPRSTGWMPLARPAREVSFALAACMAENDSAAADACIGSLFLLRGAGRGAVRIPLIYGRNVWDWWVPMDENAASPPATARAWDGSNPNANFYRHSLALYRITWSAADGEPPAAAVSIVSNLRRPAPLLMAVDSRP